MKKDTILLDESLANTYLGHNGVFIFNLLNKIDFEIPFVDQLKRGEYKFNIADSSYELYQGTYLKTMFNSYGRQYERKQKSWGIKLLDGEDNFKVEERPSEYTTNKDEMIESINRQILVQSLNSLIDKNNKIKLYQEEDFKEILDKSSKDEKIEALQRQIELMSDGYIAEFALARIYGYIPIRVSKYGIKFVHKNEIKKYKRAGVQKKRDQGILGRGIRISIDKEYRNRQEVPEKV